MIFKFFLSQKKTDTSYKQICLSIIKNNNENEVLHFKTPLFISEKEWDEKKNCPKNIYSKKYKQLNSKLNLIKVTVSNLITINGKDAKNIDRNRINTEIIKISTDQNETYSEDSLIFIISQYIAEKKHTIQLSTYRRYIVFMRFMERFEGYIARRIHINDVNSDLINLLNNFGHLEMYSESTISRTKHFLKTILHFAERKGFKTELKSIEIPKMKACKNVIILDEVEILKIKNTDLPNELNCARDWLLISCYTGQRFSDFMKFNQNQLIEINGKKCINFTQQKTNKEIVLPLHQTVLNILNNNNNSFPKRLDIGVYNQNIKKIAEIAEIKTTVHTNKRVGHRSESTKIEKFKIISSHIGRRSFASNFYGKIPTALLIQATGHSSEKMFLNYINAINFERIITLGNYFDKIYEERNRIKVKNPDKYVSTDKI